MRGAVPPAVLDQQVQKLAHATRSLEIARWAAGRARVAACAALSPRVRAGAGGGGRGRRPHRGAATARQDLVWLQGPQPARPRVRLHLRERLQRVELAVEQVAGTVGVQAAVPVRLAACTP